MILISEYMKEIQGYLDSGDTQNLKYCLRKLRLSLQSAPKVDNFTWRGKDKTGLTILEVACLCGDGELVETLLNKKIGINGAVVFPDVNSKNKDGDTPLHFLCKEKEGVPLEHLLKITKLLLKNGANKNAQNKKGETPVYASRKLRLNMFPVMAFLIEQGADLSLKTLKGKSLLQTKENRTSLLHSFLQANDPNINYKGLCLALKKQHVDLKLKDIKSGVTALHLVALQGKLDLLNFFLDEGLEITKDKDENTPLHYAAASGTVEVARALFEEDATQLNIQNKQKETPLYIAVMAEKVNIVRYLLSKNADRSLQNDQGKTPLLIALECGNQKIKKAFLEIKPNVESTITTKPGFFKKLWDRIELISLSFANFWTVLKNKITRRRLQQKTIKNVLTEGKRGLHSISQNQPSIIVGKNDVPAEQEKKPEERDASLKKSTW